MTRTWCRSSPRGWHRGLPHATVHHLPGATHWVHQDEPDRVNELIVKFLAEDRKAISA
jgi:pimeloyl-ACP methyl ester carboxylesterase